MQIEGSPKADRSLMHPQSNPFLMVEMAIGHEDFLLFAAFGMAFSLAKKKNVTNYARMLAKMK